MFALVQPRTKGSFVSSRSIFELILGLTELIFPTGSGSVLSLFNTHIRMNDWIELWLTNLVTSWQIIEGKKISDWFRYTTSIDCIIFLSKDKKRRQLRRIGVFMMGIHRSTSWIIVSTIYTYVTTMYRRKGFLLLSSAAISNRSE